MSLPTTSRALSSCVLVNLARFHTCGSQILRYGSGLIEVIEEQGGSKSYFTSGGFAVVQPGSELSVNCVEAYALEDFSAEVLFRPSYITVWH